MNRLRSFGIYLNERFPPGRTAMLVLVFSAASVSVSAHLAERGPPGWTSYAGAFVVTLLAFFQLRVLDEIKDGPDDARYRPERPIPRGLVTLRQVVLAGLATLPAGVAACVWVDWRLLGLLALVWAWMGLMTAEFFAPAWLKARPFAYMASHMLVMPAIDLLVTGFEWVPHGRAPDGLWLFLLLSFANGCVLEIGRKLWAPANERPGVESYSGWLGPAPAGLVWIGCVAGALGVLASVGFATGAPGLTGAVGLVAAAFAIAAGQRYRRDPTPARQAAVDRAAGLWVFACYAAAGFAPFAAGLAR